MASWKDKAIPVTPKKSWRDTAIPVYQPEPESNLLDQIETGSRSMLSGMSLGTTEPVFSGINAAVDVGTDYLFGLNPKDKGIIDQLKAAYNEDVSRRREMQAENPKVDLGGNIAGALLPAIASFGASTPASATSLGKTALTVANSGSKIAGAGARATGAIAKAIPGVANASKAAGIIGGATRIGLGAAEGAGSVLASEAVRRGTGRATGFIKDGDEEPDLTDMMLMGAKFGGAVSGIPEVIKAAKYTGKAALSALGGVSREQISKYVANPEIVRNAKSLEEIKDEVDTAYRAILADVESGKLSVEQADEAVKVAQQALKEHIAENKQLLTEKKFDLKMAAKEADFMANQAKQEILAPLKNVKPPVNIADDVVDAVADLKRKVIEGSKKSYDILESTEGTLSLSGLDKELARQQRSMKVAGKGIVGETAKRSYEAIQKFRDTLKTLPKTIPFSEAKKLIQQLDQDVNWIRSAGEFSDDASNAIKGTRAAIDSRLKVIPEYAKQMQEVAADTRLLDQSNRMFGQRGSAIAKLNSIDGTAKVEARDILDKLGKATGRDFKSVLDEYINTKMVAKSPDIQAQFVNQLDEVQKANRARAAFEETSNPNWGRAEMEFAQNESRAAKALKDAEAKKSQADVALATAEQKFGPVAGITPGSSENIIKSVMKPGNIEIKRKLKALSDYAGKNFQEMADAARTAQAFNGEFTRGSRNVNLWSILVGGGASLVSGDPLYAFAGVGGAGIGAMVDKFGPAGTKKILDGYIGMKGMPTIQKINRAFSDLPPEVLTQLKADLIRAVSAGRTGGAVVISPAERAQAAADIRDSGLTNIEKAKMIDQLNRNGSIEEDDLIKVMVGEEKPSEAARFLLDN